MLRQYFLQLFAEKLTKTPKHGSLFEKLLVLAKSMIFRAFSRNDSLFAEKFTKRPKHGSLLEKFGQIDDFSCSFTKWATFCNFLLKSWQKRRNMVVSSKSCKFRPNRWFFVIFHEMSHFFHLFAEKLTKTRKHGSLLEKLQLLAKSMMFRSFSRNEPLFATFCWKIDQNAETW